MTLNVRDFGAAGDGVTDDTAAFAEALAQGGRIYVPPGRFRVDFNNSGATPTGAILISGTTLFGSGANSVISPYSAAPRAAIGCASADAASFITDISIRGIKFLGTVASAGHSEFAGLLYLTGVKRLLIADCVFEGPRGDAITIASGFGGGPANERHNHQITIRDNHFDGVLYGVSGGRNPISIIDCDDMVIDGNSFTRWGRNDMPGGIDFEPDESYSVIKNVRVTNNRFSLSGGNRGHVTIATDGIPAGSLANIVIANNQMSGAYAGVCIYTATALPSVKHGIIIADNQIDDCQYVLEKVIGSVWGLQFTGNQCTSTGTGKGRLIIGNGTADYTVRDWLICDNVLICNTAVGNGITDHSENVVWARNVCSGSTQAHLRVGQGSPSTSYTSWSIEENTFLGSPSNGCIQADGSTTALLNVFRDNKMPVATSPGSFRTARGDYCGTSGNFLLAASLPSAFPRGVTTIRLANDAVITADDSGWLITYRMSDHASEAIWQEFVPFYSTINAHTRYIRKAIDASTWATWSAAGPLKFTASLTPASVSANSSSDEAFTVTGVRSGDVVEFSPPGHTAGILIGKARVSATNTVRIEFANVTAGALTPPAGVYRFSVTR